MAARRTSGLQWERGKFESMKQGGGSAQNPFVAPENDTLHPEISWNQKAERHHPPTLNSGKITGKKAWEPDWAGLECHVFL